jgi:predicted metal-binding membrane protein
MPSATALETVLKRDRAIVTLCLVVVIALAWTYTILLASMGSMDMAQVGSGMAMPHDRPWSSVDFLLMFVMWAVMMVAMMIPSAAPMILLFASVSRKRHQTERLFLPTSLFAFSYIAVWASFALIATVANWAFHSKGLMTSRMGSALPVWGGGLLLAAGLFQFTSLKHACLSKCRSPLAFLLTEWREGSDGAFVMGLRHGLLCVLCCWALMGLLFVLGIMNLAWIMLLSGFVLAEKLTSSATWLSRASGVFFIGWGGWMMGSALLR